MPQFWILTNSANLVSLRLAPILRPEDGLILDDLTCHSTAEAAQRIAAVGAERRFPLAYNPDLNPIERMHSKLKVRLRSAKSRAIDVLIEATRPTLDAFEATSRPRRRRHEMTQLRLKRNRPVRSPCWCNA